MKPDDVVAAFVSAGFSDARAHQRYDVLSKAQVMRLDVGQYPRQIGVDIRLPVDAQLIPTLIASFKKELGV